jgi:putative SOS response-associated peptidase YedK
MCGKFTAQASWREVVDFSQPLTGDSVGGGGGGDEGAAGETSTYRVGGQLPVIIWHAGEKRRRVVPMRWAIPDRNGAPKHIHARAETVDKLPTFRESFLEGRRGIVVFKTFNERRDIRRPDGKTVGQQWTINPRDGLPRGFSFIYTQAEVPTSPEPIWVCVMVTVPANELIRRTIKSQEDDPRMPAILDDGAWATWLGEDGASPPAAKALLKTMEGVNWTAAPEPPKPRAPRKR